MKSIRIKILQVTLVSLVLLLSGRGNFFYAQNSLSVRVLDSTLRTPVELATFSVKYIGESKSRYTLTDSSGVALLKKVPTGRAEVRIDFIGYRSKSFTFDVHRGANDIGDVLLSSNNMLDAITVSAVGNQMLIKQDTIEYNANAFKTEESDMLEDLIKKLPGAEIEDGKITVDGKEITKIMIDGKIFFMDDPTLASKNIPAKIVEKIRLLDRQSDEARFTGIDDGQEETVLDLSLKSGIFDGWFGNIGGSYGTDKRYEGAALAGRFTNTSQLSLLLNANNTNNSGFKDLAMDMLTQMVGNTATGSGITTSRMGGVNYNYESRNKKLKSHNSYLYSSSDQRIEQSIERVSTISDDVTQYSNSSNLNKNKVRGHRYNGETTYSPTDNTSFTLRPTLQIGNGSFSRERLFTTLRNSDSTNKGWSSSFGDNKSLKAGATFIYRQKLGKPGRTMALVLAYNFSTNSVDGYNISTTNYFKNNAVNRTKEIDQFYHRNNRSNAYSAYLTYTEPLGKNYFIQFAYRYAVNHSNTLRNTYDYDKETQKYDITDEELTRDYSGDFTNQRYELSFRKQEKKYNFMLGISYQPSKTESKGRDKDTTYSLGNFAPTARFIYKFTDTRYLKITYRGTTKQPTLNQLLPLVDNSNPLIIQVGNDKLNPSFTHNLDMEYRSGKRNRFRWFSISFRGRYTTNSIINRKSYTEDGVQVRRYINSDRGVYSADLRMLLNSRLGQTDFFYNLWTRAALNNGISYILEDGEFKENVTTNLNLTVNQRLSYRIDDLEIAASCAFSYRNAWYSLSSLDDISTWNNRVGASLNWTFLNTWNLTTDVNHRFFWGYDNDYGNSQTVWNCSLSKTFYKKRMTLKIKVYDILKSSKAINRTTAENYYQDVRTNVLGRYALVTLLYRFGV